MSKTSEWETPKDLFDELDYKYGPFSLDPCATKENAKTRFFYTKEDDGLSQSWKNENVFMNPPYGSEIGKWVKKAAETEGRGKVVALLPARTDTKWFHDYIYEKTTVHFLRGRLKFGGGSELCPVSQYDCDF